MQSNKRILVYFLLIAVAISSICSIRGEYSFDSCNNTYVPLSSLSQDLVFDYNSTYKEQSFQLSFSEIEFDYFNKITLYFSVLGDKSNNQGISVSLSFNITEVSFIIKTLYQDNLEHNLTQAFPFPEKFIGSLNATLTCGGQSNSNEEGSLVISNIVIESIEPPLVQDATTALPLYPNWLRFQGSYSTISEEILSSFYYFDETAVLNATLSFKTNIFLCVYSRVELILNNESVELKDFGIGENSISFTTRPKKGLNSLIVRFKIFSQPTDIIEINDIYLSGNLFINQEDIVYSNVIWEGDRLDHIFNLSSLKPENDAQELILHISLDYRCLGTKIYPNIFYELYSGLEIITDGEIFYLEQKESTQTIYLETYTCSFQDQLRFRIFGSTEGQGQFMIMNTSKILVESIQEFNGSTLERLLVLDDIVTSNSILTTTHEFFDVVKFCENSTASFSISFDIESDSNDSFNLIYFYLKIDETIVLFESINEKGSISFNSVNALGEGYHEIKLCLSIYGLSSPIHLKNVHYKIKTFNPNIQNSFTGNLFGVDWILGIYGLVILVLTRSVISRKRIKKDAKVIDDQEYSLENKEEKEKAWLQYFKQVLVAFVTYVVFYLPPVLLGHYHWGFILLASVCSTYAGLAAEFLEFRKISFRAFKTNVKKFLSEIDSISAFGKKLSDIFFSKFIYRTIISALVLGCLFFNIFVLLFIAERIQLAPEGISYFSFVIQNPWQGYYLLYGSIIFSILACYYMLHLAWEATFFEDNLKRVRVLGRASAFLLWGSWLVLIISFFVTTLKISIFGTIILPLLFTINYLVSDKFGKYKAEQLDKNFTRFVKTGVLWGNKKELKQAIGYAFTTRTEWNEKKKTLQKQKLQSVIIYKIKPNIPVYIHRLAELVELPVKLTENLLIEILNDVPSLGVYHKEEGMFIKSDVGENIGANNATNEGIQVEMEQTPRNTRAVGIAEEEEDEHYSELKLDRAAIERDSEVNWIGIVRNRPEPSEGWITLPAEMKNKAELGAEYDIFLFTEEGDEVAFTTHLRKSSANSWFFYISAAICSESNLYGKEVSAFVKKHKEGEEFPWEKGEDLEEKDILEWKKTKKVIEWEGTIRKGSGRGTGWLTLPMELRESVEPERIYDLTLIDSKMRTHTLTAKLKATAKGWGFYIPKVLCTEHSLIGEAVTCYIYQMEHFPVKISSDKIVRLPNSVVEEYGIKENDLFEVEVIVDRAIFREVVLTNKNDRSNRSDKDEFLFTLRLGEVPTSTEARIKILKSIERLSSELDEEEDYETFYLPKLFPDGIMGKVHGNEMIIFLGNHVPIFTPIRINLLELIHYFGCYYADGTKKGWAWRINASTPEQAVYYSGKYNELVYGNRLVYRLTYSKKPSDKRTEVQTKSDLVKYWKKNASVDLMEDKIKLRETKHDNVLKWNKCGSLGIRDDRNLVMELHLRMLEETKNVITHNINDEYNWQFLFGILEGDGFVSGGKARLGIGFSTHSNDTIIEKSLIRLGINYRADRSRVRDGIYAGVAFHFGLFEVLQNLDILSKYLFRYYPKRRHTFITRLINQASVQNLLNGKMSVYNGTTGSGYSYSIDADKLRRLLDSLSKEIE